jgi:hypothetical protein
VAENKIRADANAVNFSKIASQPADEFFAGLFAEFFVEEPAATRPRRAIQSRAIFAAANKSAAARGPAQRPNSDAGQMSARRNGVVLARIGNCLPDDLLVAEMHAVKKTDGEADLFAFGFQFVRGVDDFHDAASFKNGITLFSNSATGKF